MHGLLERHTLLAAFVILFLEDMGIPMPIPADVVIMYTGYRIREHMVHPFWGVCLMLLAINSGATILNTVVRLGGRPMVERYGRYLHLDHDRLSRAEAWLKRRGMLGIIISRSLPGIRLATVVACGLFQVPYRVYLPAQFIGVLLYTSFFLVIGYTFGPQAVEHLRLPAISLRLVFLVVMAVGLPLILRRLNRSTAADNTAAIEATLSPRQRTWAALLAGFLGSIEFFLIWTAVALLTRLMQRVEVQKAAFGLVRWLGAEPTRRAYALAALVDYLVVLLLGLVAAVVFFRVFIPRLHIRSGKLGVQILGLWIFMVGLFSGAVALGALHHVVWRPGAESLWFSRSGWLVFANMVIGLLGYAYVATEARRLAIDDMTDNPVLAPSASQGPEGPG